VNLLKTLKLNTKNNMTTIAVASNIKWYKTKGGKIGIFVGLGLLATGIMLYVRSQYKSSAQADNMNSVINGLKEDAEKKDSAIEATTSNTSDLPEGGKGCGDVKTNYDRAFNYVKCNNVWWTISKDKVKIPKWKSLSGNKTATDLLNNKYPN